MAGGSTGPWFRGLFHPTQTRIRVSNGEAATCRSACVCAYTHACRGAAWREGTRFLSPASRFQGCAPGGSSGREWPLLAEGRPPLLRLPLCPFLPKPSGSRPSPVPLVPSLTLPPPPPRCLAHLLRLFVPTLSPPPFLSPLLDLRPLFSGIRGFLWLLLCGVPAAYCVEHLAEPPPGCPFWPHSALAMVPAGASFPWASVLEGGGAERGLRGLDPQQMSDSWSVCRSS